MSNPDALLHDFQSITEPLRLEELFVTPQPTELEIGCGDGGFLLEHAQRHPEPRATSHRMRRLCAALARIERSKV